MPKKPVVVVKKRKPSARKKQPVPALGILVMVRAWLRRFLAWLKTRKQ